MIGVVAVGQLADELVGARELARRARPLRSALRDRRTRCCCARCRRTGTCPRTRGRPRGARRARRTSRTSAPSMRTCPACDVVEARDEPGDRRLARRGRADERDRLAARDHEVEAVEHGRPAPVAERHAARTAPRPGRRAAARRAARPRSRDRSRASSSMRPAAAAERGSWPTSMPIMRSGQISIST